MEIRRAIGHLREPLWPCIVLCLCLVIPLVFPGCGQPGYEVAPVSGRVTLDGQPMPGVHVSFQPQAGRDNQLNPGPGSVGVTDAEGRFTLRLSDPDRPGAVVAAHTVRMTMVREAAADLPDVGGPIDTTLPPQTRDGTLRFEVGREAPNVSR